MMTPEQLQSKLLTKQLPSFIFCFGDEPQRLLDTVDAIVECSKELGYSERNLIFVESSADWDEVFNLYQEQSLFSSQRMMLVQVNAKITPTQSDKLQAMIISPNPDVLLLLRADALYKNEKEARKAKWVEAWDSIAWVIHSKSLPMIAAQKWLQAQAVLLGMQIPTDAAEVLAYKSEGNLMSAKQSLLRWQLQGIKQVDILLLERDSQDWARYDVFALSSAILAQNVSDSLHILARLQEEGEDAVLILWAVSRELRIWYMLIGDVKQKRAWSSQTLAIHNLWGGRDKVLWRLLEQLQVGSIQSWLASCLMVDQQIKGQAVGDAWSSLRWLIADMASGGKLSSTVSST
jgi:DNA polymerase-3 subunit delta